MAYQKIDSLTSLRFFAAAAIVAYHASGHFGLSPDVYKPFVLSQGVSFFFVLSGFILAFVYPELKGEKSTTKFWLARFARIWPLHIATLLMYVWLLPEFVQTNSWAYLANPFLLQAWVPQQNWFFSLNSVSWSISTETFFYLSFPLLIKNFEQTWHYKLAGSFLLIVLMASIANFCHLPPFSDTAASVHGMMYVNPLSRVFEFVLGMTVALAYRKILVKKEAPMPVAFALEASALTAVYFLTLNTHKVADYFYRLPGVQEGGRMWLTYAGVPVLSFAALIAVMAWGKGPIARVLRAKALILLGEISFAMYLCHRLLLHYYWNHFAPEHGPLPIAIYLGVLLTTSYALWSLVEVPCRQLIVHGPRTFADSFNRKPALSAVLAPALAIGFIFATVCGVWSGPQLARLGIKTEAQVSEIAFGDDLLLLSSKLDRTDRGINLTLYWQALHRQKLNNFISMQMLSENNVLVRLKDFRQSAREESVEKGECFKNEIFLSNADLKYVDGLAFGLSRATDKAPQAKLLKDSTAKLYKGLVAIKLEPASIAARAVKPAL